MLGLFGVYPIIDGSNRPSRLPQDIEEYILGLSEEATFAIGQEV